jgi:hypothetical protein
VDHHPVEVAPPAQERLADPEQVLGGLLIQRQGVSKSRHPSRSGFSYALRLAV